MFSARWFALALPLLAGCVVSCGGAAPPDPAERCAEVVRIQRDLVGGVQVVGEPTETAEGRVRIRYRGTDGLNLPAEGSAECTFDVGDTGELTLVGAAVDGAAIDAAGIASLRRALGQR